jgi:hypothetical protein
MLYEISVINYTAANIYNQPANIKQLISQHIIFLYLRIYNF